MILIAYSVSLLAGKSQELERSGLKEVEIRADEIAGFVLIRIKRNFRQGRLCLTSDNHRDKDKANLPYLIMNC